MDEHGIRNSHKKYCIECGKVWNCRGCFHRSAGGICKDCMELQHVILELEARELDKVTYF